MIFCFSKEIITMIIFAEIIEMKFESHIRIKPCILPYSLAKQISTHLLKIKE